MAPKEGERAYLVSGPLAGFCVEVTELDGARAKYLLPTGLRGEAGVENLERVQD